MLFDLFTLKPESFGLDISDLSLKIIKLQKSGSFFRLASFGETKIKPGIIEGGEIKDENALVAIVKEAVSNVSGEKFKTRHVVASLPEEKAFLQVIQLPLMGDAEAKKAAQFEAENYIPLPLDQVYIDSQVVPPILNHLDHTDVLLAAIPKRTVDPYLSVFKKSGLKPLALEIESQAISRALVKGEETSRPLLIVDLGATRTSLIIFSGRSLRFTSSIAISSLKFTQAISSGLAVAPGKAEQLKIKYGIEDSKTGKNIFKILAQHLNSLTAQIKKYLDYYIEHTGHEHIPKSGRGVEKILLCGGGANLKGIADFLSANLKIDVELGNPWVNILPRPLKEVPELHYAESLRYATALGLAQKILFLTP